MDSNLGDKTIITGVLPHYTISHWNPAIQLLSVPALVSLFRGGIMPQNQPLFPSVIIQGGNNAPKSAIIPQCDRIPTMI